MNKFPLITTVVCSTILSANITLADVEEITEEIPCPVSGSLIIQGTWDTDSGEVNLTAETTAETDETEGCYLRSGVQLESQTVVTGTFKANLEGDVEVDIDTGAIDTSTISVSFDVDITESSDIRLIDDETGESNGTAQSSYVGTYYMSSEIFDGTVETSSSVTGAVSSVALWDMVAPWKSVWKPVANCALSK